MKVYLIEDDDTGEYHVFKSKESAVRTMLQKCEAWGCFLYTQICGEYVSLGKLIFQTQEEKVRYLCKKSDRELQAIFEEYWYFKELELED